MATTFTRAWLAKVADAIQSGSFAFDLAYFKIGEGGWMVDAGTRVPKTPSADLEDLDCIENASAYPADSRYAYQQSLTAPRIVEISASSVQVTCIIDVDSANDDGSGASPEFWELGLFDSEDVMVAYTTFSRQPKTSSVALRHVVTLTLSLGS